MYYSYCLWFDSKLSLCSLKNRKKVSKNSFEMKKRHLPSRYILVSNILFTFDNSFGWLISCVLASVSDVFVTIWHPADLMYITFYLWTIDLNCFFGAWYLWRLPFVVRNWYRALNFVVDLKALLLSLSTIILNNVRLIVSISSY